MNNTSTQTEKQPTSPAVSPSESRARGASNRTGRRLVDFLQGLAAFAVIAFLLVGVPWLLITVVGMPFDQMLSDLTDSLTSQSIKAAAALRLGLSIIVWLAWLQVAWALVIEVVAAIRGRSASPSRLVFPSFQRSARHLVASAMLVLTVFSTPAGASLAPLAVSSVAFAGDGAVASVDYALDYQDDGTLAGPLAVDAESPETSDVAKPGEMVDYVVGPGQTFWSLAEVGFGDGFRWRDIRDLNDGRVVGEGVTITSQTENLQPGWTLRLPAGAVARLEVNGKSEIGGQGDDATPADAPAGELPVVDVDQGDHFWGLAKERLTAEWGREPTEAELTPYWADMVARNENRLLPPGDPDLIYAGQQFEYPPVPVLDTSGADEADSSPVAGDVVAGDDAVQPSDSESEPKPDALEEELSVESETPTSTTMKPTPGRAIESSTITTVDSGDGVANGSLVDDGGLEGDHGDDGDMPVGLVAISGIGLVTAAIGGIIGRSQARQLGARRPGTTPDFGAPMAAQRLITETSDSGSLDELDILLRHLGAELAAADLALPDIVGALIEDDAIRLLVATPHNAAPEPFRAERGGMVWVAPRPIPPLDVRRAQNPYPLLVAVGYTDSAQLLIDLEYIGALGLDGGFADVVDLMGTMALQLATSPLADVIEVMCVGFGEELADLERLTVVPNLEAGLERVQAHGARSAALADAHENSGPAGRASGIGDWTPLVIFDPLSDLSDATEKLLAIAGQTQGAGVAAVTTTSEHATLTMELTEERVSIPAYRVNLDRRALTRTERTALATAVDRAKRPDARPAVELLDLLTDLGNVSAVNDGASSVGARPESAPATDPAVIVRLLGPLRVEDRAGNQLQFARSATPEFMAYLAHHRDGIEVGRVMNTLWPSTTARRTWIANVHADAGRTLSAFGDGVDDGLGTGITVSPNQGSDDEYRLSPKVGSDLDLFRALVSDAVSLPLDQALVKLTDALVLVEGVPYANITSRWPTNEGHWQDATVMVDEAARCVATLALDRLDEPVLAEWATAKGLLASPQSVELHRLRLRASIALDNSVDGGVRSPGTVDVRANAASVDAAWAGAVAAGVGPEASSTGLSPDAVFQHYQAVAMADDHRPEGGSHLDPELVDLYDSYRRAKTPSTGRSKDSTTVDMR